MFINKWRTALNRWSARRSLSRVRELHTSDVPLNRQWRVVREALGSLSLAHLAHYTPHVGMFLHVETPIRNIETYTVTLQNINRALMKGEAIPKDWVGHVPTSVLLDRFMLDAEGRYQDTLPAFAQFIEAALHLCELMSTIEDSEEGVSGFNERILLRFFEQLKAVVMSFHELQVALLEFAASKTH
jgi:hypothetical protein